MTDTDRPPNRAPVPPLTPMMRQYQELKAEVPDAILFYRLGDFYEMFFDDAVLAAPLLEVQLTSRDKSAENPVPMCGVPFHAATVYAQKLLAHGHKVAMCEQMEDPSTAKGPVRRAITRVLTPALIGDPDLVPEDTRNFLLAVTGEGSTVDACALDLMSGELRAGKVTSASAMAELLARLSPKEILIGADTSPSWLSAVIKGRDCLTRRPSYFEGNDSPSHQAILRYLRETQRTENVSHLQPPTPLWEAGALRLDPVTLGTLEVLRTLRGETDGPTLKAVVDKTSTPMGRRLLCDWLSSPLAERGAIEGRLAAVESLIETASLSQGVSDALSTMRDLERLATKAALGLAMPRDLVAVREILKRLPALKDSLSGATAPRLRFLGDQLDLLPSLRDDLEAALVDDPPGGVRDGGIFRDDYSPEIREYREISRNAKETIAAMETRERERTGIGSLKIRFSKVFGYTIEVTKAHLSKVPSDYKRKQTIAQGERFITDELKRFEEKAVTAEDRLSSLEEALFTALRGRTADSAQTLLCNARALAELDVLRSFARVARENDYSRPEIHDGWELIVEDGRHPVVESLLERGAFVPNGVAFDDETCRTIVITGPNMAGKSTIMRQTALIALLAHAGSFVPAKRARIPVLDAIFTRIGSSDELARGRSTFMVEMTEVARILDQASPRSLILIDEIGRGTSTYDGLSLAWSLLEYLHGSVKAKCLFATHFHELTQLATALPALKNFNVLVQKWKDEVVFLHRLAPGVCNRSYGIEVARLAKLPESVLDRARHILGILESQSQRDSRGRARALDPHANQMEFF